MQKLAHHRGSEDNISLRMRPVCGIYSWRWEEAELLVTILSLAIRSVIEETSFTVPPKTMRNRPIIPNVARPMLLHLRDFQQT